MASNVLCAIDKIKAQKIDHRNYSQAGREVFHAISASDAGEVVTLVGPSRVGKSRTLDDASEFLVGPQHKIQPGAMPLVRINARNGSTGGSFSTKGFIAHALRAVEQPIYGAPLGDDRWATRFANRIHRTSEAELTIALEHALVQRQTKYLVIDESQHLRYLPGPERNAAGVLDAWKCLAADTEVILVISGTYPLLPLLALSPHLLGRNQPIHFPRYVVDNPNDISEFERILTAYDDWVPRTAKSLRKWNRRLFQGSYGCIGHLSRWLRSAMSLAAARGLDQITEDLLAETETRGEFRDAILQEILFGEDFLARHPDQQTANTQTAGSGGQRGKSHRPFQAKPRSYPHGGRI